MLGRPRGPDKQQHKRRKATAKELRKRTQKMAEKQTQESTIAKRTGFHAWMSNATASAPMPPEAAIESGSGSEYDNKAETEVEFEC